MCSRDPINEYDFNCRVADVLAVTQQKVHRGAEGQIHTSV